MQPKTLYLPLSLSLSLLIAFSAISSCFAACDQVVCASVIKAQKICTDVLVVKSDCGACHNITAKDFMDAEGNLSQTVVIDQPGRWCLCENIDFNPAPDAAFQPAIQILASDVHLDLGEYTLRQVNKDVLDIYGVQIGYGYTVFFDPNADPSAHFDNITITNGSINNFSSTGIFCYNPTYDFLEVPFPFNSFNFTDLNVLDNGTFPNFNDRGSGINLDSAAPFILQESGVIVTYNNVIIDNCKVNRTLGTSSIFLYTVDNLVVKNTQSNDVYTEIYPSANVSLLGAFLIVGRNIQMYNCQGNGVTDLTPVNADQCGSSIENSVNVYIKDCQFNDTYGESSLIVNFNSSDCYNFVAENCQFNNNRGGLNAGLVCGIHMSDGAGQTWTADGYKFNNCQFNGTRVAENNNFGTAVCGFIAITLRNIIFDNCQASNINNLNGNSFGYYVGTDPTDPAFPFANLQNITFRNCIASDILSPRQTVGFAAVATASNATGNQGSQTNIVFENCIAERIHGTSSESITAGIAEYADPIIIDGQVPKLRNLFVKNCRVSDVHASGFNPLAAGIIVLSVENPIITNNSVSDCDRGILLTGTNQIIPNGFQLAETQEDALAFPPVFVPLEVQLKLFTIPAIPGSPFNAFYTVNGPRLSGPITAQGIIADPSNACTNVTNDLTNKIGIVIRDGACNSSIFVPNTEAAGSPIAATLILAYGVSPNTFGGSTLQNQVAVVISEEDSDILLSALEINPTLTLVIDTIPSSVATQTFVNLNKANEVTITPSDVSTTGLSFIYPPVDMNSLGWESGDPIFYDCQGGDALPDLVCSTTYYAIVYSPGFARNGVIQDNEVDNCGQSGYQDDAPTTSSAWVNNFAFNNGTPASEEANYEIVWSGTAPVYAGDLGNYPTGSAKAYNVSLVP